MLDLSDAPPIYEPDLMAPDMINPKNPRRVMTVSWSIRPERGDGWLGVSGQVVNDSAKAQTWTTFDRAETHIRLHLIGGLKKWRVSQTPYVLPGGTLNPDLMDPDYKPAA